MIWRGYQIEVRFNPDYYVGHGAHICHMEVLCNERLPITATGYKSFFTPVAMLEGYESAEAFLLSWLDHEAQKPNWIECEVSSKQMTLF